jgi:hypothetical protein
MNFRLRLLGFVLLLPACVLLTWALVGFALAWKTATEIKAQADIVLSEEFYFKPNWFVFVPVTLLALAGVICVTISFRPRSTVR